MTKTLTLQQSTLRLIFLFTTLLFSCACQARELATPVSLIELIAFPERYVEKVVAVKGYLDIDANIHLFLTKEHSEMRDYRSSIIISDTDNGDIRKSSCTGIYVEIEGMVKLRMGIDAMLLDVTKITKPIAADDNKQRCQIY